MSHGDVGIFRVAACAVILNATNQVLITQRSLQREHHPGEWEIPTGRLDQGEGFIEGLIREVKEEIAIEIEILAPINTFHFFRGPEKIEHVGITFICRHKSGEIKVDGVEEVAYKWVELSEALNIIRDESIKRDIVETMNFLKRN